MAKEFSFEDFTKPASPAPAASGKEFSFEQFTGAPPNTSRTFGEAAKDIAGSLVSGVGGAAKFGPELYGLATGDFSDTGVMHAAKKIQQYGEEMKSPGLKAREQAKEEKVKEAEKKGQISAFLTEVGETIKDPFGLGLNFIAQQVPEQLPALAAAVLAPEALPSVAAAKAAARKAVGTAAEKEAAAAATKASIAAGAAAAKGTASLQQGADVASETYQATYDKMIADGVPEAEARERALKYARGAGAAGAAVSLAAQNLPGGHRFAEALAGKAGKSGSRLANAAGLALGELPSENLEEGAGKIIQNYAQQQVDPNAELTTGLGKTLAQASLGAVGTAGGLGALQKPTAAGATEKQKETQKETEKEAEKEAEKETIQPPVPPVTPPKKQDLSSQFEDYHMGLKDEASTVFQNRDRSTPAAITQMQGLAADPRYNDLSVSRSFGSGAPVVMTDTKLPETHLGSYEMTTASDGTQIPTQYAVVEASSLLPSNSHDGSKNVTYGDMSVPAIRPIAGNGRVAGIQEAYNRDNAEKYKQDLLADTAHGIDKKAIEGMAEPVLVRVMPKSFVTPNIADISNVSGISGLSAIDSAKQDSKRVDINDLKFNEDGTPTIKSLMDFINAMPVSEHPDLKNTNGEPTPRAFDRLMNAVFWQAYGHEPLIDLYSATIDPDAKLMFNALANVAPKMAQLDGAGEYDIRKYVTQAAESVVNAKRKGINLQEMAAQSDIGTDPFTQQIIQMFADAGRSGKKMAEGLSRLADAALEEHNRPANDMFGEVPKRSLEDVFKSLKSEEEVQPDLLTPEKTEPKKQEKKKEEEFFTRPEFTKEEVEKRFKGNTPVEAANNLVEIAPDSYSKEIAEKIRDKIVEYDRRGVPMSFTMSNLKSQSARSNVAPTVEPGNKLNFSINMRGLRGTTFETLAHEFVHAVTLAEIQFLGEENPLVKEMNNLRKLIKKQFDADVKAGKLDNKQQHYIGYAFRRYKSNYTESGTFYPELVTMGLTNQLTRQYLSTIKVGNTTALNKLVTLVRKLLNLDAKYETALDRLLTISANMLETPAHETAKMLEQKRGLYLGQPTTKLEPPGKPKVNAPAPSAVESPEIPTSKATGAGRDALDMLERNGRKVEPPPEGFRKKLEGYWNNVKDNPTGKAREAWNKFSDYVQTKAFSSDAALTNKIRDAVMAANKDISDKVRDMLNISLSQTVHADALGNLFMTMGNLVYNPLMHKWEGVKSNFNFLTLSRQLDTIAQEHNMTKQEAELVAHYAFEAKRTASLIKENNRIEAAKTEMKGLKTDLDNANTKEERDEIKAQMKSIEKMAGQSLKIIHLTDEQVAEGLELFKTIPELNDVVETWNGIRENTIKILVDTGLWSEDEADFMMSNADYVPFYRDDQIERNQGPKEFLSGLMVKAREPGFRGSQKPVHDVFDNMMRWTQYAVNRSVRNSTAVQLVTAAEEIGVAERIPRPSRDANNVRIWREGKEEFYNMKDPLFVDAFEGLAAISIPTVKFFTTFSNMLRKSVVMNPLFAVSQLPQDAFAAVFSSGLKPQYALRVPVLAVKEFVKTLRRSSETHEELKKYGATGVKDFSAHASRMDALIYSGLKSPPGGWNKVKSMLEHISMASDNAVRQAVYEATLQQYEKDPKTKDIAKSLAIEKAFEVINFRRRGSSKAMMLAGQVIPFFNAYLAAQNVAYKTITGIGISPGERKAALETLAATTASVMALSLIYAMMNGDDDDYLKKPTTVRDRLLMIPGSGGLSIPLRNDYFTIPKVITEHMYLLLSNNGTEDGRKFRDSLLSALSSSILAPTAVPQAIKPLVEIGLNYDFFQQKPLIGAHMKSLETERQFNDSTSELSKILGSTGFFSPINADHFIRGMFGSVGGATLLLTNQVLHSDPTVDRPTMSWNDIMASVPGASGFITKENQNGLKKDFYMLKEEVDKTAATMNDIKKRSPHLAKEYANEPDNKARLAMYKQIDHVGKGLAKIRENIALISNMPENKMSAEQKEQRIKNLHAQEDTIIKNLNLKKLRAQARVGEFL